MLTEFLQLPERNFDWENMPESVRNHKFWGINKFYNLSYLFKDETKRIFENDESSWSSVVENVGEEAANFVAVMTHLFLTEHPFSLPHLKKPAHVIDRNVAGEHDIHWVLHNNTPPYADYETADRNRVNRYAVYKNLLAIQADRNVHSDVPVIAAIDHVETHTHVENHLRLYGMAKVPADFAPQRESLRDKTSLIIGTTIVPRNIVEGVRRVAHLISSYRKIPFMEIV